MSAFTQQHTHIKASAGDLHLQLLTPEAIGFIEALHEAFNERRMELLALRKHKQLEIDAGKLPAFCAETERVRRGDWTVWPVPAELQDRRVEITGPVERKMLINGLNSGARVYMADFEDANSPTWENVLQGHQNLQEVITGTITHTGAGGKPYTLNQEHAVLFVRPRGWHMEEKHVLIKGVPVSAALFDFGLFFFHGALPLINKGSAPYFYLPKLEGYLEARLWNEVFCFAQDYKDIPQGTIKATVLIETLPAAFEMEEILYELRMHSAGLNCGRWDYIFSYIKKLKAHKDYVLPERGQVTMTVPFMKNYAALCVQTCHKRGAHAMGGMAAFIPIKNNQEANAAALAKVEADKVREVLNGHDGTWVAHPGLIPTVLEVFNTHMPTPNQVFNKRDDVQVTAADLLQPPAFEVTPEGFYNNIDVAVQYMASWLRGIGCVPIYHLMEDAATAEISRAQLWQWIHHGHLKLSNGTPITYALFEQQLDLVLEQLKQQTGETAFVVNRYQDAAHLLSTLTASTELADFLTTQAYQFLD